jgi:hypothetical protein
VAAAKIHSQSVIVLTRVGKNIDIRSFSAPESKDKELEAFADGVIEVIRAAFDPAAGEALEAAEQAPTREGI